MINVHKISQRLNDALDIIGFQKKEQGRQVCFAEDLNVSQSSARRWLEGINVPPFEILARIEEKYKIKTEWLLFGSGEILYKDILVNDGVESHKKMMAYIPFFKNEKHFVEYFQNQKKRSFETIKFESVIDVDHSALCALAVDKNHSEIVRSNSIIFINRDLAPIINATFLVYDTTKKLLIYCFVEKEYNFVTLDKGCQLDSLKNYLYVGTIIEVRYEDDLFKQNIILKQKTKNSGLLKRGINLHELYKGMI